MHEGRHKHEPHQSGIDKDCQRQSCSEQAHHRYLGGDQSCE
jgi:hypothetical protein